MSNALNWFEIPATDIQRAAKFYATILSTELEVEEMGPEFPMVMLPAEGGVGGAIVRGEGYAPSAEGTVVYLACGPDLSVAQDKVEGAGGKVLMPKMEIGEHGFVAFIMDTEGNKVGLHSMA